MKLPVNPASSVSLKKKREGVVKCEVATNVFTGRDVAHGNVLAGRNVTGGERLGLKHPGSIDYRRNAAPYGAGTWE